MKLTREEVSQIGVLARLELSDKEAEALGVQLNRLLDSFERLREIDTDNVEPTSHTIPVVNVYRDDVVRPSLTQEEVLANAPCKAEGTFEVPRIVES